MGRLPLRLSAAGRCAAPAWHLPAHVRPALVRHGGLLLLLLALVLPTPASTQTRLLEADRLVAEADAMWDGGDIDGIAWRLGEALAILRAWVPPDDRRIGMTLSRICRNAWNAWDYAAAEAACREGLGIIAASDPGTLWHARLLGDLAAALRMRGRFAEAEAPIRESLALRRALLPPGDPWIRSGLDNMARILAGQGRLEEAAAAAEEAYAIARAASGETSMPAQRARALLVELRAGMWRQRAADATGMGAWSAALAALGAVLVLLATADWAVEAEGRGERRRWRALRAGVVAMGCVAAAAAGDGAASLLLPQRWEGAAILAWLPGMLAGLMLHGMVANALRRRAGLPRRPLLPPPQRSDGTGPLPPDVRRGLARAHITITVPVMVMWLGVMSLPVPLAMALDHGRPGSGALPFLLGFLLGFLLWMGVAALCAGLLGSWLTPRWRVWCLRHVEDIALLEVEAVERGLLPPPDDPFGRWLTPRERWTPALRAEAARLRRGRGGPAWSGEM